ncbi:MULTISPECIES: SDR family NAD(P)-dependent oxidoreductase [Roseobacteraceae]|jgi:3-oxoacyl-[acyl-carrier protein] reductase|uniref:3-oxoacyl-[acyl-carrier-protein] reductase FabG n=1 Tax=Pseudosulfitobacter pseudonitzschiae TaxID=1402135 RepID=A0A221JZM4_9RHOB|nr:MULTISPECIES: SDR family NAD(P)-dependent oxidoreductase [Roseobacteraceae]ASM72184.1 3-oxoacyl-[acyl-carrier-protein] reductase FabG [Pseudosulfitobacter pseudonitzschiae]
MQMQGQIAVITGGAQGIGFAVAQGLAEKGVTVVSWDIDAGNAEAMASLPVPGVAVMCNVADMASVTAAYEQTCAGTGVPTILINSAGITGPNATLEDYDPEAWCRVIDLNLNGTFYTNKVCVPGMKERGYGRILNIASIAGKEGNPNASAYSASKAGVIGLTKSLGKELAGMDIAVNCVTPAAARTRIFDQMSQEHIDYMLSKIPRGRFLELSEAAAMIVWAVSPENSFTTGAVFDLSGGRATY